MASELDTGVDVRHENSAADFDAAYYGMTHIAPHKANYHGYGPKSTPHWSLPLATWLLNTCPAPYLDVGCAYGHLVRDLNLSFSGLGEYPAQGVEWSPWAYRLNVANGQVWCADARRLPFADEAYGTVISLDFLEHHTPADTLRCLREMDRVLRPGGMSVHLIGAHNPAEDVSRHTQDPTHQNHEPLSWYYAAMQELGWVLDNALSTELSHHPAWVLTDWRDRMSVWRKPVTVVASTDISTTGLRR